MKREREKHITRLHIILFSLVVIVGVIVFLGVKVNKERKLASFKRLEKDFNTATTYYYKNQESSLGKGQVKVISMKTIIENGYLQDELTKKCKGYTIVGNYRKANEKFEIEYDTYIKCGDSYMTTDYSEDYLK